MRDWLYNRKKYVLNLLPSTSIHKYHSRMIQKITQQTYSISLFLEQNLSPHFYGNIGLYYEKSGQEGL